MTAITEAINPRSTELDRMTTLDLLYLMNSEDALVVPAVRAAIPDIARAVELVVSALGQGGRLFYVGAGTSGRLAVMDAAECPPTFGVPETTVQAVIAGGEAAFRLARESREDDAAAGARAIEEHGVGGGDVVVGISASGTTPFTRAAVDCAQRRGAGTVLVVCNAVEPTAAGVVVTVEVGAEVLAGSTRLKAGTAQKLVLNMLSTAAMVRLGRVYQNLMLDLRPANAKLRRRLCLLVAQAAGVGEERATAALERAGGNGKLAVLLLRTGLDPAGGARLLEECGGHLRRALERAGDRR